MKELIELDVVIEGIKNEVKNIIPLEHPNAINRNDYITHLLHLKKIEEIYFDSNNVEILVAKRIPTKNEVPKDFKILKGVLYDCAQITVPIIGREFIFNKIVKFCWTSNFLFINSKLYYVEYSQNKILENEKELDKIRINAKRYFDEIQNQLDIGNSYIRNLNFELLNFITLLVEKEKYKMNAIEQAKNKLNPFK